MLLKGKKNKIFQADRGFTLMEIVVATTIFALVSTSMLALFNNTLQINRRSEALRQATQGMRSLVEFLVKEVRNGQINYFVVNGTSASPSAPLGPCNAPPGGPVYSTTLPNTYSLPADNKIGIIDSEGYEECIYLAYGPGGAGVYKSYVGSGVFALNTNESSPAYNPDPALVIKKVGLEEEVLNPENFRIEQLKFFIRPAKDPYSPIGGYEKVQPFVTMAIKFVAELPTGELVSIYYQTTVSTNKYDVPQ